MARRISARFGQLLILVALSAFSVEAQIPQRAVYQAPPGISVPPAFLGFGIFAGAFLNPHVSDAMQYVSPQGTDLNDGFSWGTAKKTVYAALEALPGGGTHPPTAGQGRIMISAGGRGAVNYGGPLIDGGLYLMAPGDPNYLSPPNGWLRTTGTGQIVIQCGGGGGGFGIHGHTYGCGMNGGSARNASLPGLWLSDVIGFEMDNIGLQGADGSILPNAVKLGIDSNGNRDGGGGVSSIYLNGVGNNSGNCHLGGGPGIDIGSNSFWIYIDNSTFSGCIAEDYKLVSGTGLMRARGIVTATTASTNDIRVGTIVTLESPTDPNFAGSFVITKVGGSPSKQISWYQAGPNATSGGGVLFSNKSAAIAINPGGGNGSGLIFISRANTSNGGLWFAPGVNGGGMYASDISMEGNPTGPSPPTILITSTNAATNIRISGVETSDIAIGSTPAVEVDGNGPADAVIANRVQGASTLSTFANVLGPMVVDGQYANTFAATTVSPTRLRQNGIMGDHLWARTDAGRRLFSPVGVRYKNLAITNPTSWRYLSGAGTISTGITAPDGTAGAGQATSNSGRSDVQFYVANDVTVAVGDYYIFGAWVKDMVGLKFQLNANGFGSGAGCTPASVTTPMQPIAGDGEWNWVSGECKIFQNTTTAGIALTGEVNAASPATFYAPILIQVLAGKISDNEAYEIALNLASYGPNCPVGSICGLPGQNLVESGFQGNLSTKSSAYVLSAADRWVNVTGNTTVTVPHAVIGQLWDVFNSGNLTVTLRCDSGKINGAATVTLDAEMGKSVTADGTNCFAH